MKFIDLRRKKLKKLEEQKSYYRVEIEVLLQDSKQRAVIDRNLKRRLFFVQKSISFHKSTAHRLGSQMDQQTQNPSLPELVSRFIK